MPSSFKLPTTYNTAIIVLIEIKENLFGPLSFGRFIHRSWLYLDVFSMRKNLIYNCGLRIQGSRFTNHQGFKIVTGTAVVRIETE